MRRLALATLAALLALAWSQTSAAETLIQQGDSVSASVWSVEGSTVRVRVLVPTPAARKLVAAGAPTPSLATVASAVSKAITVSTPAGDCDAIDQGEGVGQIYTLAQTPGLDRFEIVFACPQTSGLTLKDNLLFDRDPGHIDYAQITIGAGKPVLRAFTEQMRTIPLPGSAAALRNADPVPFARQAAIGLATNLSALGILLGSVLLSRRWLDLAWLAGALAAGYLASFAVALSGVVVLDQGLSIALDGLLVTVIGLNGLLAAARPSETNPQRRLIAVSAASIVFTGLVIAACFKSPAAGLATFGVATFALAAGWIGRAAPELGAFRFASAALLAFLDGLAPAGDLSLLRPPPVQMAPILAGHDLGELVAATTIVGVSMALIWLAGLRLKAWRGLASECAGAALIGLGLFGFVSRLYS